MYNKLQKQSVYEVCLCLTVTAFIIKFSELNKRTLAQSAYNNKLLQSYKNLH